MNKQANIGLLLLFILIVGLFAYMYMKLNIERENYNRYTISSHPKLHTFVLDKKTGEIWRYFRNSNGGELKDEGWMRLYYKQGTLVGLTPKQLEEKLSKHSKEEHLTPDKIKKEKKNPFADIVPEKKNP